MQKYFISVFSILCEFFSKGIISRYRVLSCICYNCGHCLVARGEIPENENEVDNCEKLKRVFNRAKTVKECSRSTGGCGCLKAKYKKER